MSHEVALDWLPSGHLPTHAAPVRSPHRAHQLPPPPADECLWIKVMMYNPRDVSRAAELLRVRTCLLSWCKLA